MGKHKDKKAPKDASKRKNQAKKTETSKDKKKKKHGQVLDSTGREYDIVRRDFYLDKAGIPVQDYGTNFCFVDDDRQDAWKKQRAKYGFDEREMWNLDSQFAQWLYSRCMFFLDYCPLDPDIRFEFEGKSYDHKGILEEICADSLFFLKEQYSEKMKDAVYRGCRAARMWAEVMPVMWF